MSQKSARNASDVLLLRPKPARATTSCWSIAARLGSLKPRRRARPYPTTARFARLHLDRRVGRRLLGSGGVGAEFLPRKARIWLAPAALLSHRIPILTPGWRNGRRSRLKIWFPKGSAGSSPAPGTNAGVGAILRKTGACPPSGLHRRAATGLPRPPGPPRSAARPANLSRRISSRHWAINSGHAGAVLRPISFTSSANERRGLSAQRVGRYSHPFTLV